MFFFLLPVKGKEPDYLDYNIKGRSFFERTPYNAGAFYLTGEDTEKAFSRSYRLFDKTRSLVKC